MRDWDEHSVEVERSAVPLPEAVTGLLAQLEVEVEKLAKSSPLAAIPAARRLGLLATQSAYRSAEVRAAGAFGRRVRPVPGPWAHAKSTKLDDQ